MLDQYNDELGEYADIDFDFQDMHYLSNPKMTELVGIINPLVERNSSQSEKLIKIKAIVLGVLKTRIETFANIYYISSQYKDDFNFLKEAFAEFFKSFREINLKQVSNEAVTAFQGCHISENLEDFKKHFETFQEEIQINGKKFLTSE